MIGVDTSTLSSLRSIACCAARSDLVRIGAIHSLGSWLISSFLSESEDEEQATAIGSLLAVCNSKESEALQEGAVRAIGSLARLPSLRPLLLRLGGGQALLKLLLSERAERGQSETLLASVLDAMCKLSDEPSICQALSSTCAVDKLIQARRAPCERTAERGGHLLCDLVAEGCLSPSLFFQKDLCSELVHHAVLNDKCKEEAVWAIALLAGKQEIALTLASRTDVIKLLLAATEESEAICLQVPPQPSLTLPDLLTALM
ncbi:MAG: hypothetical protein SGPRY_001821 [Prymnesium sp.]